MRLSVYFKEFCKECGQTWCQQERKFLAYEPSPSIFGENRDLFASLIAQNFHIRYKGCA